MTMLHEPAQVQIPWTPPQPRLPVVPQPKFRRRRRWLRRTLRTALALFLAFAIVTGYSIVGALRAPGTDSAKARLAGWARDHGGTPLVNWLERVTYKPPKVGGAPEQGIVVQQAGDRPTDKSAWPAPFVVSGSLKPVPKLVYSYDPFYPAGGERFPDAVPLKPDPPPPPKPKGPQPLPEPPAIEPFATNLLPDEGQWQTLQSAGGKPVVRAAYLRADNVYTSYLSAVAWMDTKLLQFELRPGSGEPGGGPWQAGASIPPGERGDVVAAFNSGFRMADTRGGFYLGGRTSGAMRDGAATIGFYNDGSVKLGQWGSDVQMGPDLWAARQNLDLIVEDGKVNWKIDDNSGNRWGATIGNELYVWRSGVGITADGALLYASGPRLSAGSLARLLIRAGAVRAMQMDINTTWTIFIHYTEGADAAKLLPQMNRPVTTYDTTSSRDFIVAKVRPPT